ncbi:hypothetical protein [Anaerospora sp.]|uniref:hypothetical protein n=1 Tax=Anaerospora sp. TaxID=1960278 RepID=UPI00289C5671|nr:hypothetical protein [Anaerospora sp.]
MPFGKELSHLIEEQIQRAAATTATSADAGGNAKRSGTDEGRIAQIEANLQRLAETFTAYLSNQKKSKRNLVEYGLTVIALQGMRLAVTSGRAVFIDRDEPLDLPYTFLQLSSSGSERQIRYVYLDSTGVVLESTTDPTNIGVGYIPLAMVDVWSGATEVTQDKIKDIRPRAGAEESDSTATSQVITGNVSLYSPDTGNDSFFVSQTNPAGLKVNVSAGRALVAGEILNAEGGVLDLANHRKVVKEFLGISDGIKKQYELYHQAVTNVSIYVDDVVTTATIDAATGAITFSTAPPAGAVLRASYTFSGNYMLVFLVEKAQTNDGCSYGAINWTLGSNRNSLQPPVLTENQHAIAKVDLSSSITAITDGLIDNSYEIKNLTQEDLQRGGQLSGSSLAPGSITGEHITVEAITGQNIAIEAISGLHISPEAIEGQHIAVEAITGVNIAPESITGEKIVARSITSNTIAANAITSDKIAANTVTAGHIVANAVTGDKIAANSITSGKIAANSITAGHVIAGQISGDKLAVNSVTSDKVAANTITGAHIIAAQITGDKIAVNAVTSDKIAANSITGSHIIASQITGDKLAVNSVTSDKVAANTINAGHLIAGQVTGDKIAAGTITGDKLVGGTITGDKIIAGGIDTANIKTGAIKADQIAAGTINSSHIAANSITTDMLRGGTITADKFEDTTWGDMSQAMRFVKSIIGGEQTWKKVLSKTDLTIGVKSNVTVAVDDFPAISLDTQRHWDDGLAWDAGGQKWDIPVIASGYWESASIDYGVISNLQAEFWAQPLLTDPAVTITVKGRYSTDNLSWTDYETLSRSSTVNYLFWVGSLKSFRYFKIRVEFTTADTGKYAILGYPEVRAANCQIGTEDIADRAISSAKMAAGALANSVAILTGTMLTGATLPLPAGYTKEQCKWIVQHDRCILSTTTSTTGVPAEITVNPTTLMVNSYWRDQGGASATLVGCQATATIAYLVIGMK